MLTRRDLRVKAFQTLFSGKAKGIADYSEIISEYDSNIELFKKMYGFLLMFPSAFETYLISEKDFELTKYYPSKERLRECSVLENNYFIELVDNSDDVTLLNRKSHFKWSNHGKLFETIFKQIKEQEFFIDYLVFDEPSKEQQQEFILALYGYVFESLPAFSEEISDVYFNWEIDIFPLYSMLKSTIEKSDSNIVISDLYRDKDDDYKFVRTLISKTVTEEQQYNDVIGGIARYWDTERMTKVDILLIHMAITEFMYQPTIPIKVTINEYIELSKMFSTNKSHVFVNGILDKTKQILLDEGRIQKEGRGLLDNKK